MGESGVARLVAGARSGDSRLRFLGGTGTVTGSKYLLETHRQIGRAHV